jgi:hypothetical protein
MPHFKSGQKVPEIKHFKLLSTILYICVLSIPKARLRSSFFIYVPYKIQLSLGIYESSRNIGIICQPFSSSGTLALLTPSGLSSASSCAARASSLTAEDES